MPTSRRNTISRERAWIVAGVAVASGIAAASAGTHPTGARGWDLVLTFLVAAFVTWLGASTPWWVLVGAAALVTGASFDSPVIVTVLGAVATAVAMWIGYVKSSMAAERAAVAAVVVSVALRLRMGQFFLASAAVAFVALGAIALAGWLRRQRYVRRRVFWSMLGLLFLVVLGAVGMAVAGVRAKTSASDGYRQLLDGLDRLDAADMAGAATSFAAASTDLRAARDDVGGPFSTLAGAIPVVAQNRAAAEHVLDGAAEASAAAARTLAVVDLGRLQIVNGVIDVAALGDLAQPLSELDTTMNALATTLHDIDTPWLVGPFHDRLARATKRADQVGHLAAGASAAATKGPAMLGSAGPRRYLFAFTNPAEARGVTGLMGSWSEVDIDNGRLTVAASGRTDDLIEPLRTKGDRLQMSPEFFARYGDYGAGDASKDVDPKFWSNVTMPADMPTIGQAMTQLYAAATGRTIDGVFVIDPAGIAALLDATGSSISVPGLATPLTASSVEQFLLLDQYKIVENERQDLLAAVTAQTVEQILTSTLPEPKQLIDKLGPASLEGHISIYSTRADEETFLRLLGIDNALPVFSGPFGGADGLGVVTNNASGNKIENFLQRDIAYDPVYDSSRGAVMAGLTISLTNNSPTTGYPDYVIGNIVGIPTGTDRMLLSVYTPLGVADATVDDTAVQMQSQTEVGWNVYSKFVDVPAGATVVVHLDLRGTIGRGRYELIYRPQGLPNSDTLEVQASSSAGNELFDFSGSPGRRSVINSSGAQAWHE